jgi:hypothetical protein
MMGVYLNGLMVRWFRLLSVQLSPGNDPFVFYQRSISLRNFVLLCGSLRNSLHLKLFTPSEQSLNPIQYYIPRPKGRGN